MNQTYNNTNQLQKGLKTFVLTLSISLIVFSVAYFIISNDSYEEFSYLSSNTQPELEINNNEVLGVQDNSIIQINSEPLDDSSSSELLSLNATEITNTIGDDSTIEEETVFAKISNNKVSSNPRAVLADTDTNMTDDMTANTSTDTYSTTTQTTTAPVPDAGMTEMTWGLFLSLIAFALGFIVISKDPRSLALKSFEKDMMK